MRTLLARAFGRSTRKPRRELLAPKLQVIRLEDRRVLSGLPGVLVDLDHGLIPFAGSPASDGQADTFSGPEPENQIPATVGGQAGFEPVAGLSASADAAGALAFDPALVEIDAALAARIVDELSLGDVLIKADEIRVLSPVDASQAAGNHSLILIAQNIVFQDGADLVTHDGNLVVQGDVVLAEGAAVVLSTGPDAGGDIDIGGSIDGTFGPAGERLSLLAGTGTINASGPVGGNTVLELEVVESEGAAFTETVNATTITLADLRGTISFAGDLTAVTFDTGLEDYRLAFWGASNVIQNGATFSNAGGVIVGDVGNSTLTASAGSLAFDGPVTFAGNASVIAPAGGIYFNGPVDLAGDLTLEASGTIAFAGTVTSSRGGAHSLTLASHANIEFYDTVGVGPGNVLGAITILKAEDVTAYSTVLAAGLVQLSGFGTTTLAAPVTTTGDEGLDITADRIVLDWASIRTLGGGAVRLAGPVVLAGDLSIDAQGPIVFEKTLVSSHGGAYGLTLDCDAEIQFNDAVGAGMGGSLGAITIIAAVDVIARSTIDSASLIQMSGSGMTWLEGDVNVGAPEGLDITAGQIVLDGLTVAAATGPVRFNGPLELTGDVAIKAASTVSFENTVTSPVSGARPLILSSGGDILFRAAVGTGPGNALGAITIRSARDVTAASTIDAEGFVQLSGSGTTTFEADVKTAGPAGVDVTASRIVLDGLTISTSGSGAVRLGGPVELTDQVTIVADGAIIFEDALASPHGAVQPLALTSRGDIEFNGPVGSGPDGALGPITILSAWNVTAAATIEAESFVQRYGSGTTTFRDSVATGSFEGLDISAGRIVLGGPVITAAGLGIVRFNGPAELAADVMIQSEGSITFEDTLASPGGAARSLTLASGADIWFRDDVGWSLNNALGAITILAASDVTASSVVGSADFVQMCGSGTTRLLGDVTTTDAEGLNITAGQIVLGNVSITALGNGLVRFDGPVDLIGNVAIDAEGEIRFEQALISSSDRARSLTLASQGDIDFRGTVGAIEGNRLGAIRITTAADVTAHALVEAASLVQTEGFGTTTLHDDVTTAAPAGVDIASSRVVLAALAITAAGTGRVRFDAPVDLIGEVSIEAAGAITFEQTLSSSAGAQPLTLSSGGDIEFRDAIGIGPFEALGAITIVTAANVTACSTIDAASLVQWSGSGTTTLGDDATLTAAEGLNVAAGRIVLGSPSPLGLNIMNVAGGLVRFDGPVELRSDVAIDTGGGDIVFEVASTIDSRILEHHSLTLTAGAGSIRFNADIGDTQPIGDLIVVQADGGVTFGGGGDPDSEPLTGVTAHGAIDIGSLDPIFGGITLDAGDDGTIFFTTTGRVRFNGPVTLRSSAAIDTSNDGATDGAEIRFTIEAPIDSQAGEYNALILTAGTEGSVSFNADIGAAGRLGKLIVTDAKRVAFGNDFSDTDWDLAPMTLVWVEGDPLDPATPAINIGSRSPIGDGGIVLNAGEWGVISLVTTADSVRFNGAVTLESEAWIDIGDGGSDVPAEIRFTANSPIDSRLGENNDLMLTAGSEGSVSFNADIGARGPLGQLIVTDARGVAFGNDPLAADPDLGPVSTVRADGDPWDPSAFAIDVGAFSPIGDAGITLDAGDGNRISLITTADRVRFDGAVMLDSDVLVDTTNGGSHPGAEIRFTVNSPIDSQDSENNDLILTAGTEGSVSFNADIGSQWALGQLIVTDAMGVAFGGDAAADADFGSIAEVRVDGDLDPLNADAFDIDIGSVTPIGSEGILFNGSDWGTIAWMTTGDAVRFRGAVGLQSDAIIDTSGAGIEPEGADIVFDGTIDGAGDWIDPNLSLISHAGTITVTAAVGELVPLGILSLQDDQPESTGPAVFLNSIHVSYLQTVSRPYAVQLLGGGAVAELTEFLNTGGVTLGDTVDDDLAFGQGVISTAGDTSLGGTIRTLDGDIQLATAVVIADARLITAGGTINFGGSVDGELGEANDLELTAERGTVAFRADVGADVALGKLVVRSADVVLLGSDAAHVETFKAHGGVDLGSNSAIGGGILLNGGVDGLLTMSTAGGAVRFNGPVEIQSDVRIDSGDEGEPLGAEIRFTAHGTIDSQANETNTLILSAGTAGTVSFNADIGTVGALGRLIITDAHGVAFGNESSDVDPDLAPVSWVRVQGDPARPDSFGINIGSDCWIGPGGIVLNAGDGETLHFFTTADAVRFNGAVRLESDAWIDTTGGGNDLRGAEIRFTFNSPIDSRAGENNALILTAGTGGRVGFNADIGARGALGQLIVTDAKGVAFGGVNWPDEAPIATVRVDGDLDPSNPNAFDINIGSLAPIGATGIVFNGGNTLSGDPLTLTITTTGDAVRLNGAIELQSDVVIDTTDAHHEAGAEIRFTLNSPIDSLAAEKNDLILTAGSDGTVSFNADVGTAPTGELGRLIVTDARGVRFGNDPDGSDPDLHPVARVRVAGDGNPATYDIDIGSASQGVTAAAIGSGGIVLNGGSETIQWNTSGGGVRLNGHVTLASGAGLDTTAGGEPGATVLFTVNATIDSQLGEHHPLTLDVGIAGTVSFNANIGGIQPIDTLTIIRADRVTFGGDDAGTGDDDLGPVTIVKTDGAIDVGTGANVIAGGIVLNGGSTLAIATTADDVRWNGPVTLESHVVIDTQSGDSRIEFTRAGTIDSRGGERNQLHLKAGARGSVNAGAGGVFLYGNVGTGSAGDQRLGQLSVDTAGRILLDPAEQQGIVAVAGDVVLDARGNIQLISHDVAPDASQLVADRITANAGEVFVIEDGGVLKSRTGAVSNAGPRITLDPQDPNDAIVPGDPTHTVSGTIGVDGLGNYPADNLEQGQNFTLMIIWDDTDADGNQRTTVIRGLSAGQHVTGVIVDENGNVSYSGEGATIASDGALVFQPAPGSGPITFEVTRFYALTYLMTLTGDVRAIVVLGNDAYSTQIAGTVDDLGDVQNAPTTRGLIYLDDSRKAADGSDLDLNRVMDFRDKHLAGELFHFAEMPAEPEKLPLPPAPDLARVPLEASAPPEAANRVEYVGLQSEGALEQARILFIVKVGPSGEEREPHLLPEDALSNLTGLLDQFKQENLPNGLYRIYLKEAGFPRRKLIEFYKSGTSIGDPVREPGPGADPIRQQVPAAAPNDQLREEMPKAPRDGRDGSASAESATGTWELSGRIAHPAFGAATVALAGLKASRARGCWAKRVERAMRDSAENSFTRAARLRRRLQRSGLKRACR